MSKSTDNLQFSPTYRALPKNIIELEKKGLGWEFVWRKATEYFVSVRNNYDQDDTVRFKGCGWALEVKLSSGFAFRCPKFGEYGPGAKSHTAELSLVSRCSGEA
jgi:hypothetical protein